LEIYIEVVKDFFDGIGEETGIKVTGKLWKRSIAKSDPLGIPGTPF
jgi:hypothetical protein